MNATLETIADNAVVAVRNNDTDTANELFSEMITDTDCDMFKVHKTYATAVLKDIGMTDIIGNDEAIETLVRNVRTSFIKNRGKGVGFSGPAVAWYELVQEIAKNGK